MRPCWIKVLIYFHFFYDPKLLNRSVCVYLFIWIGFGFDNKTNLKLFINLMCIYKVAV